MKSTNNINDIVKKQIVNFTCNGKCSNCGECCSDLLPLNNIEIRRIKEYIRKHNIKECKHLSALINNPLDLTFPFRDNINNKCMIYEVRPEICRRFICSNTMEDIEKTKKLISKTRKDISMRNVFFNGPPLETILFRIMLQLQKENSNK